MENEGIFKEIFNKWGFRQNPYIFKELKKDDELENLFVGRRVEKLEFFRMLESGTGAFCIGGDFGTGKSSFFNKCVYEISVYETKKARSDFIITNTIRVVETASNENFLKDILEFVIREIEPYLNKLSENNKKIVEEMKGAYNITKTSTKDIGFKPGGAGGGYSHQEAQSIQKRDASRLINNTINMLERLSMIIDEDLRMKLIIPFNNLEKAKIKDPNRILDLIELLRDLMFTRYFLVFIGEKDLREWFEERGTLRSVFGETIEIDHLKIDEFKHAIKVRLNYNSICSRYLFSLKPDYKKYLKEGNIEYKLKKEFEDKKQPLSDKARVSKTDETNWEIEDSRLKYRIEEVGINLNIYSPHYITPFDDDIIEYVYEKSRGDMRWAFNILNRMFQTVMIKEIMTYSIIDESVKEVIHKIAEKRYNSLSDPEKNIINKLADIGQPVSPSDILLQETSERSASSLQRILSKLLKQPELIIKTKEGRKYKYELGYEMKILKEMGGFE